MGFFTARLRRAIPLCSSLIHHHFHTSKVTSPIHSIASTLPHTLNPQISGASNLSGLQSFRLFRSSPVSLSSRKQRFDDEREITEDTILFEGCDYNHWLITVDFPKDTPAEEKIATYERAAAQVFGSMEEAKKRIYACSTTVYDGFQVECSEETSEKFKDVAGVVFVLPDSYIDPVNKRYGGDKYINGEIIPMPPPINYMRRESRPRPQRNENRSQMSGYENRGPVQGEGRRFGPPQNPPYQQSFGPPQNPPHQQSFGHPQNPPHQKNFGPPQNLPHQQNFGHSQNPPHQQNFGHSQNPPNQQNFGHSQNPPNQQNFGHSQNLPHQQNFGPPQNAQYQQNFGPPQNPQQNFGHPQNPPHHFGPPQNPPFQQNFGPQRGPVPQQNYPFPQNAPPHQNYGVQQNFSPQQNSNSAERHFPSQQSHTPPGGVGHQDSTVAPGVWDHREAVRTDFPQGGGTENYSDHVEDQKFSKVEQSRI